MRIDAKRSARGFALAEMLVAMAVFLIVASAAFSLFNQHETVVIQQQSLSSVNIGLRNAMSQLEMDLAGAGQNLLGGVTTNGIPVAPFGLGAIVQNNVPGTAPACAADTSSWAYPVSSACFDSLQIMSMKQCGGVNAPVLAINDGAGSETMSSNATIVAIDTNAAGVLATDQTCYSTGDELLILLTNNTANPPVCGSAANSNFCMTVVTLTGNSSVVGATLHLPHTLAGAGGVSAGCPGASCSDPLGITIGNQGNNFSNALGTTFSNGAYVVNLGSGGNDIWYSVLANPSNPTDPQLMRCVGAACTAATGQVVADQVVGFKVGAGLWNNQQASATDIASYFYNSIKYCNGGINGANCTTTPPPVNDPGDFSLIRSVRISMISRTQPKVNQTFAQIKNGFDGGPYLVQQASVVVDLRNMSINEFGH
jgi:prepilin-type N-terminal cleavage/methylation domain-containing protein